MSILVPVAAAAAFNCVITLLYTHHEQNRMYALRLGSLLFEQEEQAVSNGNSPAVPSELQNGDADDDHSLKTMDTSRAVETSADDANHGDGGGESAENNHELGLEERRDGEVRNVNGAVPSPPAHDACVPVLSIKTSLSSGSCTCTHAPHVPQAV